jgi:uncharacterized protein YozE (UPF0346 family)
MYSEIYQRIKEYLETETPWKNPDFGIQDLASIWDQYNVSLQSNQPEY